VLTSTKARLLFILAVCGIMYFNRLGAATLIFDDAFYAQKAKEMLRADNWLVPVYAGKADFQDGKPIFHYWAQMAGAGIFGSGNLGARSAQALFGFVGVIFLFFFARRFYSEPVAFMASLILAFTQQYLHHARSAQPDVLFTLFFTAAVAAYYAAVSGRGKIYYYLTGIAAGCAVMTRNVPGLLVFGVIGAHAVLTGGLSSRMRDKHFILGAMSSIVVILPWFVFMTLRFGGEFTENYIGRVAAIGVGGTGIYTPWHTIIVRIIENYWPWLPFLAMGIYKEIRLVLSPLSSKEEKSGSLLLLMWIAVPFAVFQAASVRGSQYIMPIYVPFAVVTARVFDGFRNNERWMKGLVAVSALAAVLYLFLPLAPNTLDVGHYGELKGLFGHVREVSPAPVAVPVEDYWYFSNGLRFYADAEVSAASAGGIGSDILSSRGKYYLMRSRDFAVLTQNARRSSKIIARTDNFIFLKSAGKNGR